MTVEPRSSECRLATGMASPYDDDIIFLGIDNHNRSILFYQYTIFDLKSAKG